MGMKLVAQTAALFWSVDHVFCNFEVGTFPAIRTAPPLILYRGVFSYPPRVLCLGVSLGKYVFIGSSFPVAVVTEY